MVLSWGCWRALDRAMGTPFCRCVFGRDGWNCQDKQARFYVMNKPFCRALLLFS
jgi:hypothetical protein